MDANNTLFGKSFIFFKLCLSRELTHRKLNFKILDNAGKDIQKTIEQLQKGHSLSTTEITDLKKKVEQLSKLPDILETQRKENEELKDKIKLLTSTMELLLLGQVMMVFARNVPKFVLQPLKIPVNRFLHSSRR